MVALGYPTLKRWSSKCSYSLINMMVIEDTLEIQAIEDGGKQSSIGTKKIKSFHGKMGVEKMEHQ